MRMPFQPLSSQKKAEYVVDQIVQAIQSGCFKVGDRLPPERDLAVLLGVGRSSIREALSMLQIAGVLEVRHGSGTYVQAIPMRTALWFSEISSPLGEEFLQLTEARYAVEQGIVCLATIQRDQTGLKTMGEALNDMTKAVTNLNPNIDGFLDANVAFHTGLAQTTANPFLVRISVEFTRLLNDVELKRVRKVFYQGQMGRLKEALTIHQDLYESIVNKDRERALSALKRHYSNVASPLIDRED